MISIDVLNDGNNRQQVLCFENDCVSIARQLQQLVLVTGPDTSVVTGNRLYIRPRARGGEHRDHQPPTGLRVLEIRPGGSGIHNVPVIPSRSSSRSKVHSPLTYNV